jgi:hypothetical protein
MSDLWQSSHEDADGRWEPVKSPELFVWVGVETKTGRVEMDDIQTFDDDLSSLVDGWEWRRFRLVPDNDNLTRQSDKDCSVEGVVEQKDCPDCLGEGVVDSGGFTPWGAGIDIPCRRCIPNANDNQQVPLSDSSDG